MATYQLVPKYFNTSITLGCAGMIPRTAILISLLFRGRNAHTGEGRAKKITERWQKSHRIEMTLTAPLLLDSFN